MTANEFDELVAKLTDGASRRDAVRGIVGGAITSAGAASLASAEGSKGKSKGKGKGHGKGKKQRGKRAASETNAVGHGKRVFCFCPDDDPVNCRTRRVKTKKFKKLMRKHSASHRGPCQDTTTTTQPPTTQPPTTQGPTTTIPPTTQEPTTTIPPTTQEPTTTPPPTTQPPGTSTSSTPPNS